MTSLESGAGLNNNPSAEEWFCLYAAKFDLKKPVQEMEQNTFQNLSAILALLKIKIAALGSGATQLQKLQTVSEVCLDFLKRKDSLTLEHSQRVSEITKLLAHEIAGQTDNLGLKQYLLNPDRLEFMRISALLHDLGKIGIEDKILNSSEKLSEEERDLMQFHSWLGSVILETIGRKFGIDTRMAQSVAAGHHPQNASAGADTISAQIISVADIMDALLSARPYKPAWTLAEAISNILNNPNISIAMKQAVMSLAERGALDRFVHPDKRGAGTKNFREEVLFLVENAQ